MTSNFVQYYKQIAKIPQIIGAEILEIFSPNPELSLEVIWSLRDLVLMKKRKSRENFVIFKNNISSFGCSIIADNIILRKRSPTGKEEAFISIEKDNFVLNIIYSNGGSRFINISRKNVHGMVYSDPYISSLEWSSDGKSVLYLAEEKKCTAEDFYTSENGQGDKYLYIEDWGEQMLGQHQSVIIKVNIENEDLEVLSLPEGLTAGQVTFVPNTYEVIGIGTVSTPYRLGLAYSSDRESVLFHIDNNGKFHELTPRKFHAEKPIFSPDGKQLLFLRSDTFGSVAPTLQMWLMDWNTKKSKILIDYVWSKEIIKRESDGIEHAFRGICPKTVLPKRCWSSDSKRVFFSAPNMNNYSLYEIDVDNRRIRVYEQAQTLILMDIKDDIMLVKSCSVVQPDILMYGRVPSSSEPFIPILSNITTKDESISRILGFESGKDFYEIFEYDVTKDGKPLTISALYIGPKSSKGSEDQLRPLMVWPHGGPHTIRSNMFNHWYCTMLFSGFSILLPNYRGSSGMGREVLTAGVGTCAVEDVEDCKVCLDVCLKKYGDVINPQRIYGIGLSHGGLIAAHLTVIYPDLFRAICLMNAATDIQLVAAASDIPEWAFLEYGLEYHIGRSVDKEAAIRLHERSVVSYVDKVKTPTLILIGNEDLRAPPAQSINYHKLLLSRNVPTKLFQYPDNHPLEKLCSEADAVIQILKWFNTY